MKKIIALVLAAVMVFAMVPTMAMAEGETIYEAGFNENTISWSTANMYNYKHKLSNTSFTTAQRFTAEDLVPYVGRQLEKVAFFVPDPTGEEKRIQCTYTIKIWTGGIWSESERNPGTVVVSQEIKDASLDINEWYEIELDDSVTIEEGKELWIGIQYTDYPNILSNLTMVFPAASETASNTDYSGKGDICYSESGWLTLKEKYPDA